MIYYCNKDAIRTLIESMELGCGDPMPIEFRNYFRLLKEKINLMPTITKDELFQMTDLVWWEEWSPSTPDHPRECIGGGWQCNNCGIDLGKYITEHSGEHCYFDRFEEKPSIECCPCCGRKFR